MSQDDASEAEWFDVRDLPQPLAFDHKLIVRTAFQHLMQQPSVTGACVCFAHGCQTDHPCRCCAAINDVELYNHNILQDLFLIAIVWRSFVRFLYQNRRSILLVQFRLTKLWIIFILLHSCGCFKHFMAGVSAMTERLVEDLKAGAQKLEGPWEPTKE